MWLLFEKVTSRRGYQKFDSFVLSLSQQMHLQKGDYLKPLCSDHCHTPSTITPIHCHSPFTITPIHFHNMYTITTIHYHSLYTVYTSRANNIGTSRYGLSGST